MEKAEIEKLKIRNLRYRILKTTDQYYLLDVDRPLFITYFFPLFIYFVHHRCYPITQAEYEELSQSPEMKAQARQVLSRYGFRYGLGAGGTALILERIFDINKYLNFSPNMFNDILAFFILFMVIGLRLWVTRAYQLPDYYQQKGYQKVLIFPRFFIPLFGYIIAYLMVLTICFAIIYGFWTKQVDNYIVHINLLTLPLLCLSVGNLIFLGPNDYWVK